ncbi:hypothetical protein [Kitasatospora sp. NPDC050463]|uniref:hypothetical protein n=1 Tax=Kitasatospora sp. NPDC050463 TaxID=3155786 RepID=UPI0033C2A387
MPTDAAEFGTGLLRTTLRRTVHGYRWSRSPGPRAPSPFAALSPGLVDLLAALPQIPGAGWLLGEEDRLGHRHYSARSPLSAAHLLLLGAGMAEDDPSRTPIVEALTDLGRLLASLHRVRLPPGLPPPAASRALRRLHAWLTDRSSVPGAQLLRTALGTRRYATLARGCASALAPGSSGVLCHGAPGLGSLLLPDDTGGAAAMFIGEDLCRAPAGYDLGWPVGELIELRSSLGVRAPQSWQPLVNAVATGYGAAGAVTDPFWPALRIAVHAHDTIAYRPWPPEAALPRFVPLLRDLLDASDLHRSDLLPERSPHAPVGRDISRPQQDHAGERSDPPH